MSKPLPAPPTICLTPVSGDSRPEAGPSIERSSTVPRIASLFRHLFRQRKVLDVDLVPQPSSHPDDPLRWSQSKKHLHLLSLLVATSLTNTSKTALIPTSAGPVIELEEFHTAIAALTGVPLMISFFTGIVSLVLAGLYGRRPLYLASYLLFFIGSVWNANVGSSYTQCMLARALQGMSWGAFDSLTLGSIHETYFAHERRSKVLIYDTLTITTTWASPIISGVASHNAGDDFMVPFRIMSIFHVVAVPLLVFMAPESAFDRENAARLSSHSTSTTTRAEIRLRNPKSWRHSLEFIPHLAPWTATRASKADWARPLRALCAPTALLSSLVCIIPTSALWSLSWAVPFLLAGSPSSSLDPQTIGEIVGVGPSVLAISSTLCLAFAVARWGKRSSRRVCVCAILLGSTLAVIAIPSLCLLGRGDPARRLTPATASFLLGALAAGAYLLIYLIQPLAICSASFTSPNVLVAQRTVTDIRSGAMLPLNLAAGISVLAFSASIARSGDEARESALRDTAISLAVLQVVVGASAAAAWWLKEQAIWGLDGRAMKLIDMDMLKRSPGRSSTSYFDPA